MSRTGLGGHPLVVLEESAGFCAAAAGVTHRPACSGGALEVDFSSERDRPGRDAGGVSRTGLSLLQRGNRGLSRTGLAHRSEAHALCLA